ncbi:MAG TPA: helix-turn-helix domain-containing protein [Kiloniellaceae bacterium]|nr:helix-turn-helix domain-containing protein [Kiloniellaceae bacterium]
MVRKAFEGVMAGIADAVAYAEGDMSRGKARVVEVPVVDVKEARAKVGLSQVRFAETFGINVHTLRKWEQGKRHPHGPAKVLLAVISQEPETVLRCITTGRDQHQTQSRMRPAPAMRKKATKARPAAPRGKSSRNAPQKGSAGTRTT